MNRPSWSERVAAVCVERRWALFAASAALTALLAGGALKTGFNASLDSLLARNDPYLAERDWMRREFPSPVEVTFLFAAGEGGTVFDRDVLSALSALRERSAEIPGAGRLSTIIDYVSPETGERLFERAPSDYPPRELAALAGRALADRLLTGTLLSPDAALTFAALTLDPPPAAGEERAATADAVLALRDALRDGRPGVEIHAAAGLLLEETGERAMVEDLTGLLPVVILGCVLVICGCFRSLALGACLLVHLAATAACTIGAAGHLGFSFNTISVIAPLVAVIIAVANSVHIISTHRRALGEGMEGPAAVRRSIARNFRPVALASLTTAIGFLSLNMSSAPAIQDFGRIVAVGILFAGALTLGLLPALLAFASRRPAPGAADSRLLEKGLERLVAFARRRDRAVFRLCTALAVATAALLPLNETDFDRLDFISPNDDVRAYYDVLAERMNRGPALAYGIRSPEAGGAAEPAFLRRVEAFSGWLERQPEVESAASLVDVLKSINRFVRDRDPEQYVLPERRGAVEGYLSAYALVENRDFPLSRFINEDASAITLFVNAAPMSNQALIDLDERITARAGELLPQAELMHGSGLLLFARMDERVTVELLRGYSLSLALVTLTLAAGFASIRFGLFSLLPNMLPATMVFGFWALLVGRLDPFVMMLFSISIGLVVDDTVHILSHYLTRRREGAGHDEAIAHAVGAAGPALTVTTLVLALGAATLTFASTLYFQQAARLLVPIVTLALALDLVYLPTVLRRVGGRPGPAPQSLSP